MVFSIGHVLRYSPHNILLRKLVLEDRVIGDLLSVNHTEPVGWWHFTHSYVRGNWRRESTTAPSLLTKSCHDIDVLLWLLCSPPSCFATDETGRGEPPHLPSTVSSRGSLQYFKKSRKPAAAGAATNCLSCPIENLCKYSAKRIYTGGELVGLGTGNKGWPVSIVVPDIESYGTQERAREALLSELAKDYDATAPDHEVARRNWFGRCVYESDNDVCDEQVVKLSPRPVIADHQTS
jgi:predicted dehydrogenase